MTIRTDRLTEAIRIIASEEILNFCREHDHNHGIISLVDVKISTDKSYTDLMIHGASGDDKELRVFLTPIAGIIHGRISREIGLRRTPRIRFRVAKNLGNTTDILSLINELDQKYGLSK